MIDYINAQLNLWAEWERTGKTRLGYPKRAAFVASMSTPGRPCILSDEEGLAIGRAVAALCPELRQVVDCFYKSMRSCTGDQIGRHLGISRATLFRRIDIAHNRILGSLNDIAADIPVPPWTPESERDFPPGLTRETVLV